nr:O-acyltransferase like protein [Helicoverpa armigera]
MGALTYFIVLLVVHVVFGREQGREVDLRSAFDQDLYENVLDSEKCIRQLTILANNSLANQFLDASGRIPSGLLTGNWNDLGDYHQCLSIHQFVNNTEFQGKYCTIRIPINQTYIDIPEGFPRPEDWPDLIPDEWPEIVFPPGLFPQADRKTLREMEDYRGLQNYVMGITGMGETPETRFFPLLIAASQRAMLSVCIPEACSPTEAVDFFQSRIPFLNFTFEEYYCRLPNDKPFVAADYVAISILSFIGLLVLLSTGYDVYQNKIARQAPSRINGLFVSFSVYTNTRRFLNFKSAPGALECVDGIRAFSMMWVIVGHTYSMTLLGFVHNVGDIMNWLTSFGGIWINSAPITVDTFFMLSGILAVYTCIGKITRTRFIKTIHLFYLNRLLRMFPLLATMVLLQASLFNHVSDGPYWINQAHAAENCRQYWWAALLHIQNYVNPLEICLAQTWYLSVDMQLYLICPIILVFLFGRERIAWCALTAIVLLSLVSSSLYSFLNNYSAALANPRRLAQFQEYVQYYYFNTLTRAPPFFVGMIYGYLLYLCKDKKIRISKFNVAILWMLSFAMMAFCIFTIYPVMQPDHTAQVFDNFLNAYMRAIWAIGLGWLIFACVHGYGGPINWFLSLQVWKLPARLSYAMYLIHLPIIYTSTGTWMKTYYFSEGNNLYRFMGDISISFIFAFILCVCIDAPCSTLQKMLLGGGKRPQKPAVVESPEIVSAVNDRIIKTSL